MQTEERSTHYRPFLRSGSYPSLASPQQQQRRAAWLRIASLVGIAGLASGAGYHATLWLVPVLPGVNVASESSATSLPAAARVETHERDLAANVVVERASGESTKAQLQAARATPAPAHPPLGEGTTLKPRTKAPSADKPVAHAPVTNEPVALDDANWESFRSELIAERVRAFDAAHTARASSALGAQAAAKVGEAASPHARVEVAPERVAPQPTAAAPVERVAPTPLATARPPARVQGRLNVWPLAAAVNVESLNVRGSLAASSVRRALDRLRPSLVDCYGQAAQQAGRNHFGRVQLAVTIDETGRVRSPRVYGGGLPGLDNCLTGVAGKLVTGAPDTGTVAASLVLRFTP